MSKFKEYLEQVGLRGQSIPIGAKKIADKLGETLESIIFNWKTGKKPNLLISYNLPGYGVTTSIDRLIGGNKDGLSGNITPNMLNDFLLRTKKDIIIFDDFNINILSSKEFTKILNAEKSKRFVFIVNSFKPIQINSPTLKSKTHAAN